MRQRIVSLLIVVSAAAAIFTALPYSKEKSVDAPRVLAAGEPASAQLPTALPERAAITKRSGSLFATPADAAPVRSAVPPVPAPAPAAPPMPYRFVGSFAQGTEVEYVLTKGDDVFPVKEGQTLDGLYRIEEVASEAVTLRYLPLDIETRLSLAVAIDRAGRSAQAFAGGVNIAAPGFIPPPSPPSQASAATTDDRVPRSILSQTTMPPTTDTPSSAAAGTRAAHLRRQREQQLPPLLQ